MILNKYKKNDIILIFLILILSFAAFIGYKLIYKDVGTVVTITIDGNEFGRFSLNKEAVIEIPNSYGLSVLEIKDGYADMLSADCPDKICVNHMKIHYNKETIVCLPGKIIAEITGGEDSGLDGIAY